MKRFLQNGMARAVFLILPVAACCGEEASLDDAEAWEQSAISRSENAMALEEESAILLESATSLREREYLYDAERRTNMQKAGANEMRAGELESTAAIHYQKAADNWSHAAGVYAALENEDQRLNSESMARSSLESAKLALTQAVACYESAADAYGSSNANEEESARGATTLADEARASLAALL